MEHDKLQRFMFEHGEVRGELVRLTDSWRHVLERRDYPPVIRSLLGEMMASAVMLAAMLKFDGTLVMQMQGSGPIRLLVVECRSDLAIRATAKHDDCADLTSLPDLLGKGHFVITLDPADPDQTAYQGIVPLHGNTVAEALEHYLMQSEQLPTRIWLAVDEQSSAGMMLQRMPGASSDELWQEALAPAATVKADELLQLDFMTLLHRLFNEHDTRVFESMPVRFSCTCSREKVAGMLRMLGPDEVEAALAEQAEIDVACEFCGQHYLFDAVDAAQLFAAPESLAEDSKKLH